MNGSIAHKTREQNERVFSDLDDAPRQRACTRLGKPFLSPLDLILYERPSERR